MKYENFSVHQRLRASSTKSALEISSIGVVQIWNFFAIKGFKNVLKATAKKINAKEDEVTELLHDFMFEEVEDSDFDKQCSSKKKHLAKKFEIWREDEHITDGLKVFVEKIVQDQQLPFPFKSCWVQNEKYTFEQFCSRILWPQVLELTANVTLHLNKMRNGSPATGFENISDPLMCQPIIPQIKLNPTILTINGKSSAQLTLKKETAKPSENLLSESGSNAVVKKTKLSKKRRQKLKTKALDNCSSEVNSNEQESKPNGNSEKEIIDNVDEIKDDSKQKEMPDGASNLESVLEYFDSVEQENRCLKVSQEFMEPLMKENENLKATIKTLLEKEKIRAKEEAEWKILEKKLLQKEKMTRDAHARQICMDQEIGKMLLPCGHVISCENCAPMLKNCPMCRKPVKRTVKAYLPCL